MEIYENIKRKRTKISIINRILFILLIISIGCTYKFLLSVVLVFILSLIISNNKCTILILDEKLYEISKRDNKTKLGI